jgi:hypothetical protein
MGCLERDSFLICRVEVVSLILRDDEPNAEVSDVLCVAHTLACKSQLVRKLVVGSPEFYG